MIQYAVIDLPRQFIVYMFVLALLSGIFTGFGSLYPAYEEGKSYANATSIFANACLWGVIPLSIWFQFGRRSGGGAIRTIAIEGMFPFLFGIACLNPILRLVGLIHIADLLGAMNILLVIFTGEWVCTKDKPLKPEDRDKPLEHNGYYLSMAFWMIILSGTGMGLTFAFAISKSLSPFSQSLLLQTTSFIVMLFAERLAIRATDRTKFPVLMFAIYLQVDAMQTLLYLQSDASELQFWFVFFLNELAACSKTAD